MRLNLNKSLLDLSGKEFINGNIGKIVANSLASTPDKKHYLKFFGWAQKLYDGETIDIDKADLKLLKEFIENNPDFTVLLVAQTMELFEEIPTEQ